MHFILYPFNLFHLNGTIISPTTYTDAAGGGRDDSSGDGTARARGRWALHNPHGHFFQKGEFSSS